MTTTKKPTVYLAGGMENEKNLGAQWREVITPKLKGLGFSVLNPCTFEPEQLKGLHTNRLPASLARVDGSTFAPTHWHDLKAASHSSKDYKRFKNYMRRIIRYDLRILKRNTDLVICFWNKNTAKGAGTHSELSYSFLIGLPIYLVLEKNVDLPGWLHGCTTRIFDTFDDLVVELSEEG